MRALIFAICTLFAGFAQASFYAEGELISSFQLQDQFENEVVVSSGTEVLLFSRNMKGGDIIKEALELLKDGNEQGQDHLVYVADISGMPSLIARFVAIPQMKDLPFSMGLDRDGDVTKMLPGEKDKATLIRLDKLKIVDVIIFDSSEALLKALR
ncbi:hypothetical protein FM037_25480 [Shewanella psychropiezotolerans]|uniref:FAD/FMN-containing dehydrogenase n=1 Tax=Shewanella psychropiezotolerans TaxID=2593655 RepID=A0ABX5X3Q7_9GAMM|nr:MULTISPECIES: hypothetical protein [Shewanella]MPY25497.1 hypothetical protein [Shewanella sp. YLB-07]QDO85992.1 hypothetical protein FM037_25480 [Shewanella psychropiezotolerans]